MKLFWKIFASMFISFVVIVSSISYIISIRQISDAENRIIEEKKIMGSFLSKEIEVGYFESKWPFESLRKLSERKGFLFWWIVRDDGTIHLADNTSFMKTYAHDYFPEIAQRLEKENISLNRNQNYGIFLTPLETGPKKWSFWFGFSLKEVSERRKEIIFLIAVVSLSALVMLGVILYFAIKYFTKPIQELTVSAEAIGKGDLTHRVKIGSKDELGRLAHSFNKMTEDLQRTTVSKDYVDNIIGSMRDVLIVVDSDMKIRTVNKATCELLGYKEKEIIGEPVEIIFAETEILLKEKKLDKLIEEGEVKNFETSFRTKDSRNIPVLFSSSVMKDKDGKMIRLVCTGRDVTERKQTEEALLNAVQQWRTTFDGISDMVCLLDPEGKILRCNNAMAGLLKKPFREIIGRLHWEIVYGTTAPIQECPVMRMRETHRRQNAILPINDRWFNIAVDPLLDEAGSLIGAVHIMSDITDHKRAEEALSESEDRYRDLVEYSQYLICTHDLKGQILSVNQGAAKLLGYDQSALLNKNIRDLLAPEFRDEFDTYLDTTRKQGFAKGLMLLQTAAGEKRIWEYNNTLRTQGVTAPIVRAMAHDVTERIRAEKVAKRLSQENAIMAEIGRIISSTLNIEEVYERFAEEVRKLIPFDRIAVGTINLEDHSVTMAYVLGVEVEDRNQGTAFPLTGSFYEEITSTRSGILTQTEDESELTERYPGLLSIFRAGFRSAMSVPLISKDQVIGVLHFRSLKPNAYTELDLKLAERVGNQIAGAIANAQLFVERKRAEEERTALQEQLRQSQKMEAIGQLAGGVAHDFNNLLTVIHGYSELILTSLDENSRLRQDVREIIHASERASSLTRQLLAFSRKQVLQPKVLDLNAHVSNMDKMLRRMIGENIELMTLLAKDLGRTKADPGQVEQVILNLAVNARDAMLNGGKLTIETANVELDENYARSHIGVTPGHYVMLSVTDTGVGIAREVKERIFEPFFTTKEKGKGTGLGLSTVFGIIQQSGGNIWVYSEPGLGTTFKIYLPRIEEDTESLKPSAVSTKSLQGSETILLVEDEEIVRKLACTILQKNGYKVLEAPNGEEALRIVQGQNGNPIHLLVTDVVMPGMSGRQLADRLERLRPEMKILYISGYTDNAIVRHGVLEKGINYIQKPFTLEGLARKVREVLDK
jgi:PAS domain S-box-containing protein